jgi:hypothetical protein
MGVVGMIDTDKYEGHTEGEWDLHSMGDGWTIGQLKKIDRTLMQDAPLLLEEVKRLRGIIDYIRDTGRMDISNGPLLSVMEKVLTTEEYLEWRNEE